MAWENHALQPETPLTLKLASRWLQMARELGIDPGIDAGTAIDRKMTRGALLNHLYSRLPKALEDKI